MSVAASKTNDKKKAVTFIRQKIDAAKWFIDAIKQRQHTLSITMQAIIDHQKNFFITGDENFHQTYDLEGYCRKNQFGYFDHQQGCQQQVCSNRIWEFQAQAFLQRSIEYRKR